MIWLAWIVALAAMAPLCMATARHSNLLSRSYLDAAMRRRMRAIGLIALALSFGCALLAGDVARVLVTWIAAIGFAAIAVALIATLRDDKDPKPKRKRPAP